MFNRRSLLVGLGVGLILGSGMLQLMTAANVVQADASASLPPTPTSLSALKKEAEGQGYALLRIGDATYTQAQLDDAVNKAKAQASTAAPTASAKPDPSTMPEASPSPEGKTGNAPKEEKTVSFYISSGESLENVATALSGIGVITDKKAFIKEARGYSKKLRVGVSTFKGKPSFEQIIAEITRAKS